jgi:DNA-binding MarR family transcriptional regulator
MTKSLDSQDISPDRLVGTISALIRSEHRHAAFVARTMDLPLTDTLALYHLANEPLSAKELGECLNLTSGSMTALVDRLVERKIARRLPHPTDRRIVLIELTKTGHAQSWKVMQHFVGRVVGLSVELPPTDRNAVANFLQQLVEVVDTDTERLMNDSARPRRTTPPVR